MVGARTLDSGGHLHSKSYLRGKMDLDGGDEEKRMIRTKVIGDGFPNWWWW